MSRPLVGALICAVAFCSCGASRGGSGKPLVVTAVYPIEFVAQRLGGDLADVVNITPPGVEPHDLDLRPSDVTRLERADLILYLGGGFQPALEKALDAVRDRSRVVDLLADAGPARVPGDPHVWLDAEIMRRLVDAVAGALRRAVPGEAITERAAGLSRELGALDAEYRSGLASCARREIFTSHAAFAYLAGRYGLRQVAIAGLAPEAEPSPKRLQDVARLAREHHATTIFFETLVSPRVAEAVARIVGAKTAVLDPIEGLTSEERRAGRDYFSVMRANLRSLREALECAA